MHEALRIISYLCIQINDYDEIQILLFKPCSLADNKLC